MDYANMPTETLRSELSYLNARIVRLQNGFNVPTWTILMLQVNVDTIMGILGARGV